MGKESVNEKVETKSLDRINIHASMFETIGKVGEAFKDNPALEYTVKGILYEFLIDSLLNGYKEVTIDEIKAKMGCTGENAVLENAIAGMINVTLSGFKVGIQETRRSRITGKQKKIEITQPSESLPAGLED